MRSALGLPATWHKWTCPALTPARQTGTQWTYHGGVEGWVDLVVSTQWTYHGGVEGWVDLVVGTQWTYHGGVEGWVDLVVGTQWTYHGGTEGWVDLVVGYKPRRFTCQRTVTQPSSNRARCWLTTLIEDNALTATPRCQRPTVSRRRR